MFTGHLTRRYRAGGFDLFFGVLLNILSALLILVFHILHRRLDVLQLATRGVIIDPCIPLGVLLSLVFLSLWAIQRRHAYGVLFNWILAAQAILMIAGLAFFEGLPAVNYLQKALAIALWTTAFTYLPILGVFRTFFRWQRYDRSNKGFWHGFIRPYCIQYGPLLVFPGATFLHTLLFSGLLAYGFFQLFPSPDHHLLKAVGAEGLGVLLRLLGGGAFLGFFSALPLHQTYERLLFGRNVSTAPDRIIRHAARKITEETERESMEEENSTPPGK